MSGTFQQRDMGGALFKNDKGDNPARPDYRGDITINGVSYELSAWLKESQRGKFMSLSAKPKDGRAQPQGGPQRPTRQAAPADGPWPSRNAPPPVPYDEEPPF